MPLSVDLYNAFSNALSLSGQKGMTHEVISQAVAADVTKAIVLCIMSGKTTTSYTGVSLLPPGIGAVASGVGSIAPTGAPAFLTTLYGLLMNTAADGVTFASNFAIAIQTLYTTSLVTDSYVGTTIPPVVPPVPVPLVGVGLGSLVSPALSALQAGLLIPPTFVPPSAEAGNQFIASTWATAIIAYFSTAILSMTGGVTNPGMVGVGSAVGFM